MKYLNLVEVLKYQSVTTDLKIEQAMNDLLSLDILPEEETSIPGLEVSELDTYVSVDQYEQMHNTARGKTEEHLSLLKLFLKTPKYILPKGLFLSLLNETRLVLLHQVKDNTYIIPELWKRSQIKLREKARKYGKTPIRRVDLRQAFPSGILKNDRDATEFDDRVKITLPLPPEKVQERMFAVVKKLSKNEELQLCTLADPRSLGTELFLGKTKPAPARPSRKVDPGLVVVSENFVTVLPETFYNLSELEKGLLDRAYKITEQWDAKIFLLN